MQLFGRGTQCAYRLDDNTGNTYDAKGKVCGGLTNDDKMWIGIATGLGTVVFLGLGLWVFISRRRTRRALESETDDMRQTYAYSTPLLGWGNRPVNAKSHMDQPPAFSPPLGSPVPSSPSSIGSHSEAFHFPILSADGHLLPPAPASISGSPTFSNHGAMGRLVSPVLSERPLPSPPMEETAIAIPPPRLESRRSPRPLSSQDYSGYAPVSLSSGDQRGVIGLWPEAQAHNGGGYSDSGDIGQISRSSRLYDGVRVTVTPPTASTPRLSPGLAYLESQTAQVQQSRGHSYESRAGYRS